MPAIYSNITRLQASEQAVSKGTIDYLHLNNFAGGIIIVESL